MTESTGASGCDRVDDEALRAAIDRSVATGHLIIVEPATLAALADLLDATTREGATMTTHTADRVFAAGDRVANQPPYGCGIAGTVGRVRRLPATGRQACRVEWDNQRVSWELADDLIRSV